MYPPYLMQCLSLGKGRGGDLWDFQEVVKFAVGTLTRYAKRGYRAERYSFSGTARSPRCPGTSRPRRTDGELALFRNDVIAKSLNRCPLRTGVRPGIQGS